MAERITFAGEVTAKAVPDAASRIPLPEEADPNDEITILIEAHATIDVQLVADEAATFGIPIPAGSGLISLEGWRAASRDVPNVLKSGVDATVQVVVIT